MKQRNLSLWFGGSFLTSLLILSLSSPLWYPNDPYFFETVRIDVLERAPYPPAPDMLLGSDGVGRDLLSRLLFGFQWTFLLILLMTFGKFLLALPLGVWAGMKRKWLGRLIETWSLYVSGFPALLVMLILFHHLIPFDSFWGRILFMVAVVALLEWARIGLAVKGQVEQVMRAPYVEAARTMGRSNRGIMARHLWPMMRSETVRQFMFECSRSLMVIGQLAIFKIYFLGSTHIEIDVGVVRELGLQPEWGSMLGESRDYMLIEPVIPFFIAGLMVLTILAFYMLGEGLHRQMETGVRFAHGHRRRLRIANFGRWAVVAGSCVIVLLMGWKLSQAHVDEKKRSVELESDGYFPHYFNARNVYVDDGRGYKLVAETAERFHELGMTPLSGGQLINEMVDEATRLKEDKIVYHQLAAKLEGKDDTLKPFTFFATLDEKTDDAVVRVMRAVAERLAATERQRTLHFVLLEGNVDQYLEEENVLAEEELVIRFLPEFASSKEAFGNQELIAVFTRVSGYAKRSAVEEAVTQSAWRNGHYPSVFRGMLTISDVSRSLNQTKIPVLELGQDRDSLVEMTVDIVEFLEDKKW